MAGLNHGDESFHGTPGTPPPRDQQEDVIDDSAWDNLLFDADAVINIINSNADADVTSAAISETTMIKD